MGCTRPVTGTLARTVPLRDTSRASLPPAPMTSSITPTSADARISSGAAGSDRRCRRSSCLRWRHRHRVVAPSGDGSVGPAVPGLGEELGVDLLDDRDRARREPCPALGHTHPACASVGGVDLAFDQALTLQAAQHLRGHLDIGARLRGQRDLARTLTLLVQPLSAGEQHELDMGEIERRQRPGDATRQGSPSLGRPVA